MLINIKSNNSEKLNSISLKGKFENNISSSGWWKTKFNLLKTKERKKRVEEDFLSVESFNVRSENNKDKILFRNFNLSTFHFLSLGPTQKISR